METFNTKTPLANAMRELQNMQRVNIKGKMYATVASRVDAFRKHFPTATISTHLIHDDEVRVVVEAKITVAGTLLGTGMAEEQRGKGLINTTSALENAETSAIGRSLASIGLGGSSEYASSFEVENAISQQAQQQSQPQQLPPRQNRQQVQPQQPVNTGYESLKQLGLEVQEQNGILIVLGQTFGKQQTLKELQFFWDAKQKIWWKNIEQQVA
jgi:hypothetical protein